MNYIIFGGSGFIGTHLIKLLKSIKSPEDRIYNLDIVMPGEEGVVPGVVEEITDVTYIRLDVRKSELIKDGETATGARTKVKVVKNKCAPPFKTAEFDMIFGAGISNESCILDLAVQYDIIQKSGAWFSYNGEKIGQGRENVRKLLVENVEFCEEIEKKVREKFMPTAE